MKLVVLFLLSVGWLFAQGESAQIILSPETQEIDQLSGTTANGSFWARELIYRTKVINGVKTLLWYVEVCTYPPLGFQFAGEGSCVDYNESDVERYSEVNDLLATFYSAYPDGDDQYGHFFRLRAAAVQRDSTTASPTAPPNPQMIFLDGLGDTLMAVDMTNFATVAQVVVPSTTGPLGVRPVSTGSSTEVWVANSGLEVTVANLSTQSVVTNILTPSIPQAVQVAGIVFTPVGTIALEAVQFYSPDSSGNNGALLVFDTVGRTVTATLPLKYAPTTLLMAPDGSTAYILSNGGMLTYYDVLSGTADLSLSTYTPGLAGGYGGGHAFIHPDGTRLFWNTGPVLNVFDVTAHKIVSQFNSGLPTTAGISFNLSQDGGRAYMSNGLGAMATLDTYFGNILASENTGASTLVFGGPPVAP